MQVAHILDKLGRGEKRQLIVNAILAYTMNKKDKRAGTGINPEALRETVRSMVIEVLKDCGKSSKSVETDKQDERKPSFNSVPPAPKRMFRLYHLKNRQKWKKTGLQRHYEKS